MPFTVFFFGGNNASLDKPPQIYEFCDGDKLFQYPSPHNTSIPGNVLSAVLQGDVLCNIYDECFRKTNRTNQPMDPNDLTITILCLRNYYDFNQGGCRRLSDFSLSKVVE